MAKFYDDPTDEMKKGPHAEPDGDESLESLMGEDIEGSEDEDDLFGETPLEAMLRDAGLEVSPDKLARIQAIIDEPAKKGPEAKPGSQPPGGAAPTPPVGGMVPKSMPKPSGGMPSMM